MPIRYFALWSAFALALVGCRDTSHLAPLSGKVTYKGQPLEFGSVMLQPVQGGEFSRADIQSDGSFVLQTPDGNDGATIGLNRVRVTCFPGQKPGAPIDTSGDIKLGKSLIPEKYNNFSSSELTIDVLPEENPSFLIELTN
jgi:hypothetical protein